MYHVTCYMFTMLLVTGVSCYLLHVYHVVTCLPCYLLQVYHVFCYRCTMLLVTDVSCYSLQVYRVTRYRCTMLPVTGVAAMLWQMFIVKKVSAASFLMEKVELLPFLVSSYCDVILVKHVHGQLTRCK